MFLSVYIYCHIVVFIIFQVYQNTGYKSYPKSSYLLTKINTFGHLYLTYSFAIRNV